MSDSPSVEAVVNAVLPGLALGFTRDRSRWTSDRDAIIAWRVTVERDGENWGPTKARIWLGVIIIPIHDLLVAGDRFYYPASRRTVRGTLEENLLVAAGRARHQFLAAYETNGSTRSGLFGRKEPVLDGPEHLEHMMRKVGVPWLEKWSDHDRLMSHFLSGIAKTRSFYPTVLAESFGDYAQADAEYARLRRAAAAHPEEADLAWVVREIGERYPRLGAGTA
jgi:hypothetical protein